MKISLKQKTATITCLEEVNLPDFTILTGLNGSGKTQLLKSLKSGSIIVEGIPAAGIHYYDALNFRLQETANINSQQIGAQTDAAWAILSGKAGNPRQDWLRVASTIFTQVFGQTELFDNSATKPVIDETDQARKTEIYDSKIRATLYLNPNFKKHQQHASIISALKQFPGPIHTIDRLEFGKLFEPTTNGDHILSSSLSVLFTKYKVDQFLWGVDKFTNSEKSVSQSELASEFAEQNPPPWELVNKVLDTIHKHGGESDVFNFEVTDPSKAAINLQNLQSYTFIPQLTDKQYGKPRPFSALSSGEQTLLALAISIIQISKSYQMPELLLLDEIDGSLHPSMAKALIETLREVFVSQGTSIILATHSPSTVALAPQSSVHVVKKLSTGMSIIPESRGEAIQVLSEGFIAMDGDLSILKFIPDDKIGILTEGNNTKILTRLLELQNITNAVVIDKVENRTGDSQIKTFYELLSAFPFRGTVLCVWDCDCLKHKYDELPETNGLYHHVIPKNSKNLLVKDGIENAFSEDAFGGFKIDHQPDDGGPVWSTFNGKKKEFSEEMAKSDDVEWFEHFGCLVQKIKQISNEH